ELVAWLDLEDRYGGVLIMLNSRVFEEPSVQEIYPGDFNAQLMVQRPHVGTTCCQPGEGACDAFSQAQALQSTVHQELAKIESTELHQVRHSINSALLDAVEKHFPHSKPADNRLSAQGEFRASAKHTWQLYREMKAAYTVTAHSVFRQWQAAAAFMKASKALRHAAICAVHADDPAAICMTEGLAISDQAVQQELQKLGSIAGLLGPALRQHFQDLPQYAYAKSRDAILRVHMHFEEVGDCLRENQINRPNIGRHTTTNGLKQGCCIAPFLWSFYTVAVMHTLRDKLGSEWLQQALVLFADDHWCQWIIKSKADFEHCLAQLTVVLETLLDFKMSVNYKKTAVLLRLEGKQAKAVMREHTRKKNGETSLCIMVKGQEQLIPVKETHEHLGTKVTYHHRLDRNLGHRLQSGQAKYQALRKVLNGHHSLHVNYRLRLWAACVQTSKHYSLPAVGLTRSGLEKLTTASTKQIRAIQKLPSHLTRTTNNQVWQQAGMLKPGQALLQALQRFRAALQRRTSSVPDITTRADVHIYVARLEANLSALLQQQEMQDAQLPVDSMDIPCPYCDEVFSTENAMRIHSQLAHQDLPPRAASSPTQFVPRLHACGGPQCRLCLRTFYKWQNLKEHIESGACDKLGGESLTKHPVKVDAQAVAVQPSRESNPPDSATGVSQNVPLFERVRFAQQRHDWESLLRDPSLHSDLQSHCTLCHMWIASFRHVKQHICKVQMTDPSQGLNPEADIFAFCSPTLLQSKQTRTQQLRKEQEAEVDSGEPKESTQPPKRPRPEPNPLIASRQSAASNPRRQQRPPKGQSLSAEARLMAKLLIYHEDQLAAQRMDKDFVLFMRQDYASIIPNLHAISVEWHAKKEEGVEGLTSSLRTLLLACLVKEMLARVQKMASTQEGQEKLQRTKWMDLDQQWTFLRWCHKTKKLVVDDNKPSLSHTELVRQLTFLLENLRGDVIHKFHSTKGLDQVEENASNLPSVTFLLGTGRTSSRDARGSVQAAGLFGLAADRSINEAGRPSASTSGQAIGQDALRQVSDEAIAVQQLPGAIPHVHRDAWHIPNFSLLNSGNHCYAISFMYSLDIAMHRAHQSEHSPAVLQCLQGYHRVKVFHHLGFLALGWQEPERQHDVTEFIDFLHPKLFPRSFLGAWQGRSLDDDAVMQRTEDNPSSLCIGLGALPKHSPDVQSLINRYAQEFRQALMQKAPWLFLQLPRFRHQAGRIAKAKQCYALPVTVKVPIFRDNHTMAVQWQPYSVVALICHRGATPSSGHYYVVTPGQRGYLALDDDKKPADVGADTLKQVSRDMYVIVLALSSEASHSVAGGDAQHDLHSYSQQEATAPTASGHGFHLAEVHGPPRRGMDCQSDLPAGSASPSDVPRYGNSATTPQQLTVSDLPSHAQPAPPGTAARVEKLAQQVQTNSAAD
ncbi:Pol, partial [Symbiodinium necroappetens]